MKTLLTVVSSLTIMATPVLAATTSYHHHRTTTCKVAQAVSPGYGTENPMPFTFDPTGKAHQVITPNQPGNK